MDCGTGSLKDLHEGEFEYTGIDIAENMLQYASERGYKTIHSPTEEALPPLEDRSYDFVFALSSLLFVEDIQTALAHINRIARQAVLLSLDDLTKDYIDNFTVTVYNHSKVFITGAKDDYFIRGWTSPTTGITLKTRMIYIPKN
ncbi:MAG: class I SAM-dependent methyltransferase [Cyanothece sp. SIO2G6]|nr:class I SAM-dependent methyltransferase [Cyanothece sp. SIO2G6]